MIRRTGAFMAADEAGNAHKISIMTDFVTDGPGTAEVASARTFLTVTGEKVHRIKSGVFQVDGNDGFLRSSDRQAK
jgi:hypothetical protein